MVEYWLCMFSLSLCALPLGALVQRHSGQAICELQIPLRGVNVCVCVYGCSVNNSQPVQSVLCLSPSVCWDGLQHHRDPKQVLEDVEDGWMSWLQVEVTFRGAKLAICQQGQTWLRPMAVSTILLLLCRETLYSLDKSPPHKMWSVWGAWFSETFVNVDVSVIIPQWETWILFCWIISLKRSY